MRRHAPVGQSGVFVQKVRLMGWRQQSQHFDSITHKIELGY
jgi:hypothetical protein